MTDRKKRLTAGKFRFGRFEVGDVDCGRQNSEDFSVFAPERFVRPFQEPSLTAFGFPLICEMGRELFRACFCEHFADEVDFLLDDQEFPYFSTNGFAGGILGEVLANAIKSQNVSVQIENRYRRLNGIQDLVGEMRAEFIIVCDPHHISCNYMLVDR